MKMVGELRVFKGSLKVQVVTMGITWDTGVSPLITMVVTYLLSWLNIQVDFYCCKSKVLQLPLLETAENLNTKRHGKQRVFPKSEDLQVKDEKDHMAVGQKQVPNWHLGKMAPKTKTCWLNFEPHPYGSALHIRISRPVEPTIVVHALREGRR